MSVRANLNGLSVRADILGHFNFSKLSDEELNELDRLAVEQRAKLGEFLKKLGAGRHLTE